MPGCFAGWCRPVGRLAPIGVTADALGARVAIPAPGAEGLEFCLFDATGTVQIATHRLTERVGEVFLGHIPGVRPGARYGLRALGPWAPEAGLRFDPAKLLLDPWAVAIDRPFRAHPVLAERGADSAFAMPKAILPAPPGFQAQVPPPRPGPRVIYELHVRGFTMTHPEVPEPLRGTFAGLGHPAAIAHLQALGVTHVELMPAAAGIDERHLGPLGLTNYWNYNPVALLAPCPKLAPGGMAEVRAAVAALRAAGIGTILDVVFNHSGEGDAAGPTLSLRGLNEGAWYRRDAAGLVNDSGCGNTLALDRPWPMRLAMDALRHWAVAAGVEGFRLDLGTSLGRRGAGFDPDAPLLAAMRQDPVLRERIIIAEPWDIGPGGHRLGQFPPGWGEWNDRFRDTTRRFWRGDAGMLGEMATRLAGSADVFHGGRPVADSINFVTAHDGFTLADLVSFTGRRNLANGEEGRDGAGENLSWNCGVEGPTEDPAILARRAGDVRALLATLLLARGTPMLSMGDEAGRTQGGNNNAYAQDNATAWMDWARPDAALTGFTARLIQARLRHRALHLSGALTGATGPEGLADVTWRRADGEALGAADWAATDRRLLVADLFAPAAGAAPADRALVVLAGGDAPEELVLPAPRPRHRWTLLADSADPARDGLARGTIPLAARSVLLLIEAAEAPPAARAADPALLGALAAAAGLAPAWHDLSGREYRVPEDSLRAILAALRLPAGSEAQARDSLGRLTRPRALPASLVLVEGQPLCLPLGPPLAEAGRPVTLVLRREDGSRIRHVIAPGDGVWERAGGTLYRRIGLPAPPEGRHVLEAEDYAGTPCRITITPAAGCFLPPALAAGGRRFGLAAQAYALRRPKDQGVGDYTAVAELARLAAAQGAMLLGLSPPHALMPVDRERVSPYQPSDRHMLEPALIDVARLPFGLAELPQARAALAAEAPVFAALAARDAVDWPSVQAAKRRVLAAAWAGFDADHPRRSAFQSFLRRGGDPLARFCAFTTLAEREGHTDTARWPDGLRAGDDRGVREFLEAEEAAIGFHAFQQWLADVQLEAAGKAGAGLYRDLAVGAAPDGAEVWSGDGHFLRGVSVGAPPDQFAPDGQVWGIPPGCPLAAAEDGDAAFARLIRANMRHAAALRIDHVMGLSRLFLVPDGARGAEGAYLAYPHRERLGQLALESRRANCLVVGEDLGTVPPGLREELAAANVLSYRVLWFEREGEGFIPPARWPALAAGCVSTHDLPTLAGWWLAEDVAEREALGLLDAAGAAAAREGRAAEAAALLDLLGLPPQPAGVAPGPEFAAAVHRWVGSTPAALLLVQAEDLAGERVAVNLPGTDRERPNWRQRLGLPVAALAESPLAAAILAAAREGRA